MKTILLSAVGLAAMAVGIQAASAADLQRRTVVTKAPVYEAIALYNWTGFYAGINGGGGFGGRTGFGGRASGGLIGGTLGYNWQAGQLIYGLETDLAATNIRGSGTTVAGLPVDVRNSYLGTVRGRIGYAAWDRVLPYVTGGLAYGDIRTSSPIGGGTTDKAGYTIGAGVEAAIAGPWTAKVEYLYVDLGRGSGVPVTGQDSRFSTNIVRAGLNYRF